MMIGVKENNYLGKGIKLNSNLLLNDESIKGIFSVTNPNYKNSDKSLYFSAQSSETDRLTNLDIKQIEQALLSVQILNTLMI